MRARWLRFSFLQGVLLPSFSLIRKPASFHSLLPITFTRMIIPFLLFSFFVFYPFDTGTLCVFLFFSDRENSLLTIFLDANFIQEEACSHCVLRGLRNGWRMDYGSFIFPSMERGKREKEEELGGKGKGRRSDWSFVYPKYGKGEKQG
jgi:hypothetical protein